MKLRLRSLIIASALVASAARPAIAQPQEKVTLAAPQQAPAVTEYTLRYFAIDLENQRILIELKANTGELKTVIYKNTPAVLDGQGNVVTPADNTATTLIVALNTANLSTRSLKRRILERLIQDGHIAGTASGGPPDPDPGMTAGVLRLSPGQIVPMAWTSACLAIPDPSGLWRCIG